MATTLLATGSENWQESGGFFDRRRALFPIVHLRDHSTAVSLSDADAPPLTKGLVPRRLAVDDSPLPASQDREAYYGDRHLEYWLSGLKDAEGIKSAVPALSDGTKHRLLDFGGCTGRVARHFTHEADWEPWLCDINVNYIDWMVQYLPRVTTFQNRPQPHLPISDAWFDVVAAFSVFTHLDHDEIPWLLELRRITRPGGYLYLTVNDEYCWDWARQHDWLATSMGRGGNEAAFHLALENDLPADRYVLRYHEETAYNVNVVFRREYVRERWGRFFSEIALFPGKHNHQTVVILRP